MGRWVHATENGRCSVKEPAAAEDYARSSRPRWWHFYVYTIVTAGACISSLIQANITDIKKNVLTFLLGRSVGSSFREHHHAISQMV